MDKKQLAEKVTLAKGSGNHFEALQRQVDAILEYILEQPKEPEVRKPSKR